MEFKGINKSKEVELNAGDYFVCDTSGKEGVLRKIFCNAGVIGVIRYEKPTPTFFNSIEALRNFYFMHVTNIKKVKVDKIVYEYTER